VADNRRGRRLGAAARDRSGSDGAVPEGMRIAAAWSWRVLLIGAVIALIVFLIIQLRLIVIPVMVAMLLTALLAPVVDFLHRHRWPRGLAIVATILGLLVIVAALVVLVVTQVMSGFDELQQRSLQSYEAFRDWLLESPLHITDAQFNDYVGQVWGALQQDTQVLINGALSVGSSVGHFLTGALLTVFALIFMLIDGKGIWGWIVRLFPRKARAAADGAGKAGWQTLRSFVRVQILVASIDAVGIGLGAFILGLPLAVPVAVLVFLGSFIPIVGAVITGALAVFIALVYNGWLVALIMLGVVLLVQQIEGHILQPLIMGTAVRVHPLAVVLVVASGTLLAGIPGALFSVPLVAVLNVIVRYVAGGSWRGRKTPPARPSTQIWQTVPQSKPRWLRAKRKPAS